jgi:hypothetical protein
MAGVQFKRFGFGKQLTYWQQLEQRRERSKALREDFEARAALVNSSLSDAGLNKVQGAGELAAQAALKRIAAETEAKFQKMERDRSLAEIEIWKNPEPKTSIKVGDSTIDLSGDTLTLSNGTRIDLKTGNKVPEAESNYLTLADGTRIDKRTGHKVIDIVA